MLELQLIKSLDDAVIKLMILSAVNERTAVLCRQKLQAVKNPVAHARITVVNQRLQTPRPAGCRGVVIQHKIQYRHPAAPGSVVCQKLLSQRDGCIHLTTPGQLAQHIWSHLCGASTRKNTLTQRSEAGCIGHL